MSMNSNDWAKLWVPVATELVKELMKLIFSGKEKKGVLVKQYLSPEENTNGIAKLFNGEHRSNGSRRGPDLDGYGHYSKTYPDTER